jgi:hypothetical protein
MAISPNTINLDGDSAGILLTSDSSSVWTTNIGNLFTDSGLTAPYDGITSRTTIYLKPFNRTAEGTVVAGAGTAFVSVMGVVPEFPHYPMEWTTDKRGIVVSVARTGRVRGRILGDGALMRDYKLVFNNRRPGVVEDFETFHSYHYPAKQFKYRNLWHGIDGIFRFDSAIKGSAVGRQRGNLDVALAQVPYDASLINVGNKLLDNISVVPWGAYGLTRLMRRYYGPLIRVKDDSDVEADILMDANGDLAWDTLSGDSPYRVITFYDQTGNGRDWSNKTGADEMTLDVANKAVDMNNQFLSGPSLAALTEGEIFAKLKVTNTTGGGGLWDMGSTGFSSHVPFTDNLIYESFGTTVRKDSITPGVTMTDWHTYSVYSKSAAWANYINGVQKFSTGTNSVGFPAAPSIGRGLAGNYYIGQLRGWVIYPSVVTNSERAAIHAGL